ncbi:hypothetical protein [Roseburia porci]|nr:hypothetical protein [Roseburia porci]
MGEEQTAGSKKKADFSSVQIIFSAIALAVLFILELYVMLNFPTDYRMLGIFGVLMLVALYLLIVSIQKKMYQKETRMQEQYDMILRSEKASYLMLKKTYEMMEKRMGQMEQTASVPADNIINAQKAIAKVTINRNRENAEALLNSNDQVMDMLEAFQEKFHANNEALMNNQKTLIDQNNQDILSKQQELLSNISELDKYLKSGKIQDDLKSQLEKTIEESIREAAAYQAEKIASEVKTEAASVAKEAVKTEAQAAPVVEEEVLEPESVVQPEVVEEAPIIEEVVEPATEEVPIVEEVVEPATEEAPIVEEVVEPATEEAPIVDEVVEPAVEEAPIVEEVVEPAAEETPVEAEPVNDTPAPDLSDPNRMMTPEEIAALIANM